MYGYVCNVCTYSIARVWCIYFCMYVWSDSLHIFVLINLTCICIYSYSSGSLWWNTCLPTHTAPSCSQFCLTVITSLHSYSFGMDDLNIDFGMYHCFGSDVQWNHRLHVLDNPCVLLLCQKTLWIPRPDWVVKQNIQSLRREAHWGWICWTPRNYN